MYLVKSIGSDGTEGFATLPQAVVQYGMSFDGVYCKCAARWGVFAALMIHMRYTVSQEYFENTNYIDPALLPHEIGHCRSTLQRLWSQQWLTRSY